MCLEIQVAFAIPGRAWLNRSGEGKKKTGLSAFLCIWWQTRAAQKTQNNGGKGAPGDIKMKIEQQH